MYNEKYVKAKTKFFNRIINTNFCNNKKGFQFICLSVIFIYFSFVEAAIIILKYF